MYPICASLSCLAVTIDERQRLPKCAAGGRQGGAERPWERSSAMRARKLIDGSSFGPETVKAMGQAFDQAWAEIAAHFGDNPTQIENARLKLAEAMLSVATDGSTDVAALKAGALQVHGHGLTIWHPTAHYNILKPVAVQLRQ